MFKKDSNDQSELASSTPFNLPDPWTEEKADKQFPSPLELDRLLSPDHPLLEAAASHGAIAPTPQPLGFLAPPKHSAQAVSPTAILLEHDLKLSAPMMTAMTPQIATALALLYWLSLSV